jgi:hypothetical protein
LSAGGPDLADEITVSAPFGRVDLEALKRPRLGGKEPENPGTDGTYPNFLTRKSKAPLVRRGSNNYQSVRYLPSIIIITSSIKSDACY